MVNQYTPDHAKYPRPQREVAEKLGISRRQLQNLEKSAFAKMRESLEQEAADAGKSTWEWLFEEEESEMSRQTKFEIGEAVLIRGLRKEPLKGVIISLRPKRARVTDPDPVFEGAETTDGIRKIPTKPLQVRKRT